MRNLIYIQKLTAFSLRQSSLFVMAVALGVSLNAAAQTVQYVTLHTGIGVTSTNYAVQPNQLVSLVGYDWNDKMIVQGTFTDGTSINLIPYTTTGNAYAAVSHTPQICTGLTNIAVTNNVQFGWVTFQITTPATANVISNYVPADAIVIPASATGNVQIILESSSDLVNWTAASPGTYGPSSATNRFFRVRAAVN